MKVLKYLILLPLTFLLFSTAHAGVKGFKTPSKNIFCIGFKGLGPEKNISYIRCEITHYTFGIGPKPKDCEHDWGPGFGINDKDKIGERLCVSETIRDDSYPTLNYGQVWNYSGLTCKLEKVGLTCSNKNKHGFFLSKDKYKFF